MADQLPGAGWGRREDQPGGLTGLLTFMTLAVIVAALYFGREVLVPLALAVLLSFLLAPAVHWLRHFRVGRVAAVGVTVLVAFLAIFAFVAVVTEEIALLGPQLPEYQYNLESKLRALPQAIPLQRLAGALHQAAAELQQSEKPAPKSAPAPGPSRTKASAEPASPLPVEVVQPELTPLEIAQTVVGPLLQPLAMAGLVIVLVIFVLLNREELRDRVLRLAGSGDLHRTTEAMNEAAYRVSRYLLSQLSVNAVEGTLIGLGLVVIGIPNAALWGILVMLLRFIPYLGIVIAACFPMALAIAIDPGWWLLAWTAILFVTVEVIVANVVEPWLYAGSTGLSSIAVIIAAVFWTWLWGPIGLLLSTPLTACLLVLGRHVPQLQFLDVILGSEAVLTPDETFYQRLLADDSEEATEQAELFVKDRPLEEFFEEVALPVLARAQADSDRGVLPPERRATIKEAFATILENLFEDTVIDDEPAAEGSAAAQEEGFVVCMAGRNELDEAAAMLFAGLLQARGHAAYVFAADSPAALGGRRVALRDADILCVALVSTSSPARARHLVRRLRRRVPQARIVLGFWGLRVGDWAAEEARNASSADAVVTSLADAIADIEPHLRPRASATPAPQPLALSTPEAGAAA